MHHTAQGWKGRMERPVKIDREWGDPDRGGTVRVQPVQKLKLH
jgi:hypothetical protein